MYLDFGNDSYNMVSDFSVVESNDLKRELSTMSL